MAFTKIQFNSADEVSEFAENIINTLREPLLVLDKELRVIKASRSFYDFFKVTPEDTIGELIYDLGNNQWDIPKLRELLETILPEKTTFDNYEVEHDFSTIGKRIMLLNARQIERVKWKEKIILLAIEDITERKEIEAGLEKTRKEVETIKVIADEVSEFAENIINTIREPLLVLDSELRVVKASQSFYDFFKVTPEETIGKLIYELGNNQWDIPKLRELLETILPEETTFNNYEVEHVFSGIGKRIMLLNSRQIERAFGKEKIILLAIEDITERRTAEKSFQEDSRVIKEYLGNLFNYGNVPIIVWDNSLIIKQFNHAFEKLSGYSWEEVLDKNIDILFPKDKINSILELVNNVNFDDRLEDTEIEILTKDNDIRTVLWNSANVYDMDGRNVVATIAQGRDITKRKRADEESQTLLAIVKKEKSRLSALINSIPDEVWFTDTKEKFAIQNPSALKKFVSADGLQDVERLMDGMVLLLPDGSENPNEKSPSLRALSGEIITNLEQIAQIPGTGELQYRQVNAAPVIDASGNIIGAVTIVRDITKQKLAEQELISSEIKYRSFFENSMDAILLTIPHGKTLSANQAACTLFGCTEEELIEKGKEGILDITDPNLSLLISERDLTGKAKGELTCIRKDGTHFLAEISSAIFKNNEGLERSNMIIRDITERKKNEGDLIKAKEKAEQSDTLKSEFLNQMSHEIRSPMNAVLNFTYLLKEEISEKITPEILTYFDGINSASHRLIRTVDLILNVSEMQVGTYEPSFSQFDLVKNIIKKIIKENLKAIENKGLKFNFFADDIEAIIIGDEYSVSQIFVNLLDNSIKYTRKGFISINLFRNDKGINVSLEDSGIGISEDFIGIMYSPFMQEERGSSRRYDGNGLGLSLVKKYCDLNNIEITVESTKGVGTKFNLLFTRTISPVTN